MSGFLSLGSMSRDKATERRCADLLLQRTLLNDTSDSNTSQMFILLLHLFCSSCFNAKVRTHALHERVRIVHRWRPRHRHRRDRPWPVR